MVPNSFPKNYTLFVALLPPHGCIVTTCYGPLREQGAHTDPRHSSSLNGDGYISEYVITTQAKIDFAMIAKVR